MIRKPPDPKLEPEPEAPPSRTVPAAAPARPRAAIPTQPVRGTSSGTPRRLWLGVATTLAVLVLAAGGLYLVRGLTAAPPVSSQTSYQDPDHRFTFRKPTLWSALQTATGVQLTDSDGSSTAVIAVLPTATPETANTYADQAATQMGLGTAPLEQIGGVTWEQRSGQVTDLTDGAVHKVVLFVTIHDGLIYTITFTCPIASYTQINNLVYQPLLASFRFED